jgi:putative oxidoreductase
LVRGEIILRYLDRLQPLGLLVLRLVLGAVMIAHGSSKLFGGMSNFVQTIHGLGLPGWTAYLAMAAEFFGGIAVVVGLFTRLAAFAITIDMGVAIVKVHGKNGLLGDHGYQFPLALAAIAFALIFFDAGPIALDHVRGGGNSGKRFKSA